MPTRKSNAEWNGDLKSGKGRMAFGSGAFEGQFSFDSRFESGTGTNPEELLAAAHAGCFSMAFSNILDDNGHTPESVKTTAAVSLGEKDGEPHIGEVKLTCQAKVPGISQDEFDDLADKAKRGCPVSKLFADADISLEATLV